MRVNVTTFTVKVRHSGDWNSSEVAEVVFESFNENSDFDDPDDTYIVSVQSHGTVRHDFEQ